MAPYPIRANFKIGLRSLSASQSQSLNEPAKQMTDSSPGRCEAESRGSRLGWSPGSSRIDQSSIHFNQLPKDVGPYLHRYPQPSTVPSSPRAHAQYGHPESILAR